MKYYLIFLIGIIMVMGFASATISDLKPTLIGQCKQIVSLDDQTNTNTITFILRPDGSIENIQKEMTNLGNGSFNYTYCNTNISGTYTANGIGNYSGSAWNYEFVINRTGSELDSSKSGLYIVMFIFALIIFAGLIYLGIIIPFKNNTDNSGYIISINTFKYFKILAWFLAYLVFTVIIYFAWMISLAFLDLVFVSTLFKFTFYALAISIIPGFIIMIVMLIIHAVKDSNLADELTMGRRYRT